MKTIGFLTVVILSWPLPAAAQTYLFSTGWENAPSTGCSFENLTDNVTFANDYGPASSCDVPIVEVVDDEKHSGTKSLRVNMLPNFGTNGPDFRIGHGFGSNLQLVYLRWYQKFSDNYFFRQSDHKMVIWGPMDGGQHYYFQLRGNPGNTTARVVLHVIPVDGLWESTNATITRGVWHLFEARMQYGSAGSIELRMDGVPITLVESSTSGIDLSNFDPGVGMGYVKWDTTYNGYDDPAVQAATPFWTWIDDFAACSDTWCTSITGEGGGGQGGSSSAGNSSGSSAASGTSAASSGATSGAGGSDRGGDGDGGCRMATGRRGGAWWLLIAAWIIRSGSNRRRRTRWLSLSSRA